MDVNRLREDVSQLDWSAVIAADSIDKKVNRISSYNRRPKIFNSLLVGLYDVHAPIRPVRMKHLPAPLLTEDLKKLIEKKNRAKLKYKINNSDLNRDKYKKARNHCNTSCRDAQRRYTHRSVENGDTAKT
ncbi:uncharacterized protein LOC124542501 [Vanessa cardui]|uniref:uncharacterized protein LOC124542501 n=1 Tax=Vanessa cardui TaxID=171605 RepID=UPI001F12B830|nr:uncharacterized protein LOC124542501 [Vanessa cardui]